MSTKRTSAIRVNDQILYCASGLCRYSPESHTKPKLFEILFSLNYIAVAQPILKFCREYRIDNAAPWGNFKMVVFYLQMVGNVKILSKEQTRPLLRPSYSVGGDNKLKP